MSCIQVDSFNGLTTCLPDRGGITAFQGALALL